MGKSQEEKEALEIFWPLLFLVTGCSLLLFSFVMKFIDGRQPKLMLWGGLACLLIALLIYLGTRPVKKVKIDDE
jgi:hypothetical protein